MQPHVFFVDGPNAVGKDYFIEGLTNTINGLHPEVEVINIRATDYLPKKVVRKYEDDQTNRVFAEEIFRGHIKLLCDIADKAKENTVIILNRTFITYLVYNVYPRLQALSDRVDGDYDEVHSSIEIYGLLLQKVLPDAQTTFVRLDLPGDSVQATEDTIERMLARGESKEIDKTWVRYLIDQFRENYDTHYTSYKNYVHCSSEHYKIVAKKYLVN